MTGLSMRTHSSPRFRHLLLRTLGIKFRRLCWALNSRFRNSITVSRKQGLFTVWLVPDESVGKSLYCYGEHELDLMTEAMTVLRSVRLCPPKGEGTILDVGANNGITSIAMLNLGELKRAIAIEPEPRNFQLLVHNVRQNALEDRVACLPYAASDRGGQLSFELSEANDGDHRVRPPQSASSPERFRESGRRVIGVQCETLCDLMSDVPPGFTRDVTVIWVDVQGYEGYVFKGAKKLLSAGIPVVSEIWPYGIRRAGMSEREFVDIAEDNWTSYWVRRKGRFVQYPINTLPILFEELGYEGDVDNVIFTRDEDRPTGGVHPLEEKVANAISP
ncbi:MAG: hypothetical protein DMG25_00635 [Acidobacteria bacterium]|nr:MAG: hypothetical protein DMG25_00635 [Acidobacteriota bacterium]